MSPTSQKPHRRNMSSIGSGNDSFENLLATPNQHDNNIINNSINNVSNTRQYTSQQNMSLFDNPKSQNSNFLTNNEKSATTLSPPPTPSKQKPHEHFPSKRYLTRSFEPTYNSIPDKLDFKKGILLIMFLWALVAFLASLCGIGPVDKELLYRKGS